MPRSSPPPPPTDAELEVLRVLWSHGPSTVRDVHEVLGAAKRTGYTTTLKLLQNMHAKALVERDDGQRQHLYWAAVEEEPTLRAMVRRLVDGVFNGSSAALSMHALGSRRPSAEEIGELKALLRQMERESDG